VGAGQLLLPVADVFGEQLGTLQQASQPDGEIGVLQRQVQQGGRLAAPDGV
jgi:hypothetical protein